MDANGITHRPEAEMIARYYAIGAKLRESGLLIEIDEELIFE